ncbi:hypothetical protein RN346_06040 [Halomonas sp. PAMB 3232]|uniref:hypothetical protein n=1 Tax=Halomonas sp. PAMB 3232 TaxID=3075221 RepID=UPI00289B9BE8|nr:hypothetical protein [Halomonas sp. PAMB 3232]WNL40121.1 hypothetical protein RN346_06040 [Halomonas sp. PAMB 3232]
MGALCLWLLLWAGQLGRAHPNNAWIEGALSYKLARAEALPSPKILIVAGSSAMFGIDSGALETAFGRPAVNLGVNAGLSLPVILASAEPVIEAGDLVLLPLEYSLYNRNEAVSASLVHWANSHPEALWALPLKRALGVIAQTSLRRLLEGYRGVPEGFTVSGDYGAHHLDRRGDQTGTARARREPRHWRFLNSLPAETYGETARRGRFDGQTLRAFRDSVLVRGACPIFLPAPLLYKLHYADAPIEAAFYANLPTRVRRAGLMWMGTPEAAMYEADDFFDTNFHLVDEARARHTQRLIEWLDDQPFEQCRHYYQTAVPPGAGDVGKPLGE